MSEVTAVQLNWPKKEMQLRAVGATDYKWLTDEELASAPKAKAYEAFRTGDLDTTSPNLLIAGDALDALGALRWTDIGGRALAGGIRLVYIDPPFNTGRTFDQYGDSLEQAKWLSMLRDRLLALKPHLANDASIWVHLDDSEAHHARCIMNEVFGPEAFVTTVVWQKRTTRESRSAFSSNHDYIHVYAPAGPRVWKRRRNLLQKDDVDLRNRDDDPRGPWADAPFTAPGFRANQQYPIVNPAGAELYPPRGRSWYATRPTYEQLVADDRIWFPRGGAGLPRLKLFPHQLRGLVPFSVWASAETGTNDEAKRHLLSLFPGAEIFDTPKPETLLERIIHISTDPGELVVDLFAGSGTTACTAQKMGRRWITVERLHSVIADFTHPRLQHVIAGNDPGGITAQSGWQGGSGYAVLEVPPLSSASRRGEGRLQLLPHLPVQPAGRLAATG